MLITQACRRARAYFGENHQKYADALIDFGFFLLNVDAITESVKIYKEALEVRKTIFGQKNFHVAISHEDLAYALYVQEYSSGRFLSAKSHVELAIKIMVDLVPPHHLMLASAKRVKALILEEIALDNMQAPNTDYEGLLIQSEELHRSALQLSLEAFGERNVQTAKHYGNLGRLYQSMTRFEEAEQMHIRAIQIKTDLLGAYDYEVGLSIGHLASLYNYHMQKHREAETLYLKSVSISMLLFSYLDKKNVNLLLLFLSHLKVIDCLVKHIRDWSMIIVDFVMFTRCWARLRNISNTLEYCRRGRCYARTTQDGFVDF